jgi:hypothetical protein
VAVGVEEFRFIMMQGQLGFFQTGEKEEDVLLGSL